MLSQRVCSLVFLSGSEEQLSGAGNAARVFTETSTTITNDSNSSNDNTAQLQKITWTL